MPSFLLLCFFRIRSLISILAGVMSFMSFLFGTLGVGGLGIVFSIMAVWIGLVLVLWGCSITLGVGDASRGSVSGGALADLLNVTLLCIGRVVIVSGTDSGLLLRIASNRLSVSSCSNPFSLLFPFIACVKLLRAFDTMSARDKVGCVIYFILKNTVSDTLSLLVCLT